MQRKQIAVIGTIAILYSCGVKTSRNATLDALQNKRILSEKNLERAMEIADNATTAYFTGDRTAMARYELTRPAR